MSDLATYLPSGSTVEQLKNSKVKVATKSNDALSMTDFLKLMVTQFQNQSIDNTMDTSDMLNQMVQMSVVQAITNITDATVMMYAGSLVNKEVTIGQYVDGKLEEIVGTVTGTGVSGGQQVVFVDGKSYYLSEIMAVGRLPEVQSADKNTGSTENPKEPDPVDPADPADETEENPADKPVDPVDEAQENQTEENPETPLVPPVE